MPEYYFFFQIPILIFLTADLLVKEGKVLSNFKTSSLFFVFIIIIAVQNFSLVSRVSSFSLFYKQQAVEFILKNVKDRDFRITYFIDRGNDVGFDYFLKLI